MMNKAFRNLFPLLLLLILGGQAKGFAKATDVSSPFISHLSSGSYEDFSSIDGPCFLQESSPKDHKNHSHDSSPFEYEEEEREEEERVEDAHWPFHFALLLCIPKYLSGDEEPSLSKLPTDPTTAYTPVARFIVHQVFRL